MIAALALAVLPSSAFAAGAQDPLAKEDVRARAAFARLAPNERREVLDFLDAELVHVPTFQMSLVRWTLQHQERDPAAWPKAEDAPFFDPRLHAPVQPIERHRLEENDARAERARKDLCSWSPARALRSGWAYDWGARELRRLPGEDDPQRVFDNALAGLAPRLDLCEALVLRALDDGAQQKPLAAFAHAYTDRQGAVFPGVTLFDAWASGEVIEMPDIDCLGIVHDVLGDHSTWTAPVTQQASLYARIGELFQTAQRHRGLREALARVLLSGAPEVCCGYEGSLDNFHALWEDCQSDAARLRERLPGPERWKEFLAGWVDECHERGELFERGIARRRTLESDARDVRATLLRVLDEYGAYARLEGGAGAEKTHKDD